MNWYKLSQTTSTENKTYNIGPYHNLTLLGCGEAGGCAYFDSSTGHAIKQTVSETEVSRAMDLLDKDYVFFPHVYNVTTYGESWLIEREEIPSLDPASQDLLDTVQMALEEVNYDREQLQFQLIETLEDYGISPDDNYDRAMLMSNKLLALIDSVESIGGLPGEIRGDNIGIRNGEFVVRDIDV